MNAANNLIVLLLLAVAIAIAALASRRANQAGALSLLVMTLSIALWSLADLLDFPAQLSWFESLIAAGLYLGVTLVASAQFVFSLAYTNRISRKSYLTIMVAAAFPIFTQILFWIPPTHRALFTGENRLEVFGLGLSGSWAGVTGLYIFSLVLSSVVLILETFSSKPRPMFFSSWTIPVGAVLPGLALLLVTMGVLPANTRDILLIAFTLAAIGFAYGMFSQKPIESIPLTRDVVVEGMNEGWMVLDANNIIVDINPAAEKMVGTTREKAYGQPINSVLGDISNLGRTYEGMQELDMKRSFKSQEGGWRYLNIRISPLSDDKKKQFGHLISWRDITERRMAEDARQRARDEMFVLLNAISSEASEAMSLEEFLTESIYQIIYPFRSQVVCIFLADDKKEGGDERKFFLQSHFGLATEAVEGMPYLSMATPLFGTVMKDRQPLQIDCPEDESQLPTALRNAGSACLLIVPLSTQAGDENKTLGCICLGRKEKPAYSQDEIVRIITISDHLANLIDSDRRRKLAISLSERQHLMRDLHDSVSQKLYGLVTLTEAAQAAMEAGTKVDPSYVLSKIGENARQAVKEMRLFLYQMQPVDLETEGLTAVLHHRLSAVEGRADMKARLLADEHISLSMEKEVALYYIAQEALNNILKHARAKNVLVTLKQGRKNVILEIKDDGCGFDPRQVDRAGLGLANMSERASKIKGKLKLGSRPNEGTTIVVTVARDQPVIQPRRRR